MIIALSDETTALVASTSRATFRAPYALTIIGTPRCSLNNASTSGIVTVDMNVDGVSILSTKLTIDQDELVSTTAATPCVVSDTSVADFSEITFDIDTAGTDASGLKIYITYVGA
jgi:hypothetical protein